MKPPAAAPLRSFDESVQPGRRCGVVPDVRSRTRAKCGSVMTNRDAEIGVLGAGPAGARAAELLAEAGADVLLWDARAPWEKPCGGGIPASTFRHVPELHELRDRAQKIESVRFQVAPGAGFPVPLDRSMYMISRKDLARWQIERAQSAGARLERVRIRSIDESEDGWRVRARDDQSWRVRLLVGADGAASLVRRAASPDFRVELAPTRVSYPEGRGPEPETILVRLYEEVEGYFWDFSRPDHRSVGMGTGPGAWNRSRLDREIDTYRSGGPDATDRDRTGAVIGTAAFGHGDFTAVGGTRYGLLGDAAGFADPATGEGIQSALRSASLLAEAYRAEGDFGSYPLRARKAFEEEFRRARILRQVLFEAGIGPWLVRKGERARWARALVSAVMNATNEHDLGIRSLLRRSAKAYRSGDAPQPG